MPLDLVLLTAGAATALAGAARSTWSPCGLSMLSSITPFGERSRGHNYVVTAAWFVLGATIGGATLGLAATALSVLASASGFTAHPLVVGSTAAAVALLGMAVDAGVFGHVLPIIRRQVDDAWLSRYRSWVYGTGFGWQIGTGVATYVMTSAVFVFVALVTLSGRPIAALSVSAGFGFVRGTAVLLTSRVSDPSALRVLHRSLDRAAEPVRWAAIMTQGVAAVAIAAYVGTVFGAACVTLAAATVWTARGQVSAGVAGK